MKIKTSTDHYIDSKLLSDYFSALINQFFKILPIREQESDSLSVYLRSLQLELIGCHSLITVLNNDALFITLLSILQYFIDNPDSPVKEVKREVFHAISICNKLKERYSEGGDTA